MILLVYSGGQLLKNVINIIIYKYEVVKIFKTVKLNITISRRTLSNPLLGDPISNLRPSKM